MIHELVGTTCRVVVPITANAPHSRSGQSGLVIAIDERRSPPEAVVQFADGHHIVPVAYLRIEQERGEYWRDVDPRLPPSAQPKHAIFRDRDDTDDA